MIVALDTSVIVAGLVTSHPHHARAVVWLEAAASHRIDAQLCSHGIAEAWAVLTRLPLNPRLGGAEVRLVLQRLRQHVRTIPLEGARYDLALERCVDRGLRSGAIFDALHLVAAEESGAEVFLTLNIRDFERLAATGATRVAAPSDPPSLRLD